jgi:hypothetical protein
MLIAEDAYHREVTVLSFFCIFETTLDLRFVDVLRPCAALILKYLGSLGYAT